MSYYDAVPIGDYADDWDPDGEDEREYMEDVFRSITRYDHERRTLHDTDGYFAKYAFDEECLAFGHKPGSSDDEEDDPYIADGTHTGSWDGETICTSTKYGVACTYCESECDFWDSGVDIWDMVRND